jgi:hypothetical protein
MLAVGADVLLVLIQLFLRGETLSRERQRHSQWWVSGRSPEGEQHYLLKV